MTQILGKYGFFFGLMSPILCTFGILISSQILIAQALYPVCLAIYAGLTRTD